MISQYEMLSSFVLWNKFRVLIASSAYFRAVCGLVIGNRMS